MAKEFDSATMNAGINQIWSSLLIREWQKCAALAERTARANDVIKIPNFDITSVNRSELGHWDKEKRVISISLNLLRYFEWDAVVAVLKHEVAHQIVSEYFHFSELVNPHGEIFVQACRMIGADPSRTISTSTLAGYKGNSLDPIVDKVKKLMFKGNNDAVTEEEAKIFLAKAHEIMLRYNLNISVMENAQRVFVQRPVTPAYGKFPNYLWKLTHIICEYYNVKCILMWSGKGRYMELFGETHNVDVAEYVFQAILNQADIAWREYYEKFLSKKQNDIKNHGYSDNGRASFGSFMMGLLYAYEERLIDQSRKVEEIVESEGIATSLIHMTNKLRNEMYQKAHPSVKTIMTGGNGYHGNGHNEGRSVGSSLRINHGITSSSNNGKYLN